MKKILLTLIFLFSACAASAQIQNHTEPGYTYTTNGTTVTNFRLNTATTFNAGRIELFAKTGVTGTVGAGVIYYDNTLGFQCSDNNSAFTSCFGSNAISGMGTSNLGTKFTGLLTIGNSTYFDNGTSSTIGMLGPSDNETLIRFQVRKDSTQAASILMQNRTSGVTAQSAITARSGTASNDITIGVTSAGFTPAQGISASAGKIVTGMDTIAGLAVQTLAGNIYFQPGGATVRAQVDPTGMTVTGDFNLSGRTSFNGNTYTWPATQAANAVLQTDGGGNLTWSSSGGLSGTGTVNVGTKWTGASTLANSTYFDDGTSSTIGTLAASDDPPRIRFQVAKDQPDSTNILVRNNTSAAAARAAVIVRSSGSSNDLTMGVTSGMYSNPGGGISALAGFIYTGAGTSAGMTLQTALGNIYFQPAGTTVRAQIDPTGMTVTGGFNLSGTTTFNGITYTWPAAQTAGTFLTTNGTGGLAWSSVGGGGGGLSGSGTAGVVAMFTAGTALGNSTISQVTSGGAQWTYRNSSAAPNTQWYETDQAADEKLWALGVSSGAMFLATRTDADAAGQTILSIARAGGTAVSGIQVQTPLSVIINGNSSNDVVSQNTTTGTNSRATFRAISDTGGIYMGVTSSTYTFIGSAQANQGFVATTDPGTVNGIVFKSVAGPFLFRPGHGVVGLATNAMLTMTTDYALELTDTSTAAVGASGTVRMRNNSGTLEISQNGGAYAGISTGGVSGSGTTNLGAKFTGGTSIGNSTYFDDGTTSTIGKLAAADNSSIRFQVQKDINGDVIGLIRNNTSGTGATVKWGARSGGANNDISMGVTSAMYAGGFGIPAGANAVINTGSDVAGGLYVQTAAGAIRFQVGGTTTNFTFSTAGNLAATSFTGNGSALTALSATNITTGVLGTANGGSGAVGYTSGRYLYYNGATFVSSRLSEGGTDINVTSGSININGSSQGIRFASSGAGSGVGFDGNAGGVNGYIGSTAVFAFDNTSSTTATNLYVYYNGTRVQVQARVCTADGASHRCMTVD